MALDILILVVILAGALLGFSRGIIGQAGQLAAVAAGCICSRLFGDAVARFFAGESSPEMLDYVAGYAVAFIAAYLLTWVIARVLRKVVSTVRLGIVDRLAGAVFKAALWTLMLSLALNLYLLVRGDSHLLDHPEKPWRMAVIKFAPAALGYLNDLTHLHNDGQQ